MKESERKSNYPSGILIGGFREVLDEAEFHQRHQEFISEQMAKLYSMFTTPYIVVHDSQAVFIDIADTDTRLIESGVFWRDEEAKSLHDKYGEMLADTLKLIGESKRRFHERANT